MTTLLTRTTDLACKIFSSNSLFIQATNTFKMHICHPYAFLNVSLISTTKDCTVLFEAPKGFISHVRAFIPFPLHMLLTDVNDRVRACHWIALQYPKGNTYYQHFHLRFWLKQLIHGPSCVRPIQNKQQCVNQLFRLRLNESRRENYKEGGKMSRVSGV